MIEAQHIARRFIAKAVQNEPRGPHYAQYAAPGQMPRIVMNDDGSPTRYATAEQAETVAMKTLLAVLNSRDRVIRRRSREVMGPDDFAIKFAETGIVLEEFATLIGSRPDRVREMMTGTRIVPFWLWWGLEVLKDRAIAERALDICDKHITGDADDGEED